MDDKTPALVVRVDIDTWEGASKGIPMVTELLERHGNIKTSILLATGPDHTGRNLKGIIKAREFYKLRIKALRRFSPQSLLSGVVFQRNTLDKTHLDIFQDAKRNGHEIGLHGFNHYLWASHYHNLNQDQQTDLLQKGIRQFQYYLHEKPKAFAAPGFKWTKNLLIELDKQRILCSSDFFFQKRQFSPFHPKFGNNPCKHLQIPVTYPLPYDLLMQGASEQSILRLILKRAKELIQRSPFAGMLYVHAAIEPLRCKNLFISILIGLERLRVRFLTMSELAKEFSQWVPTISLAG